MLELSPSFWLSFGTVAVGFVSFLAVLNYKDKERDKAIEEVRKVLRDEIEGVKRLLRDEEDRFKRTKSELYSRVGALDGEIIGLKKDITHIKEGLSESNNRLNVSIADFKVEMVKSETRITQHMDSAISVMKDTFRDAIGAIKDKS